MDFELELRALQAIGSPQLDLLDEEQQAACWARVHQRIEADDHAGALDEAFQLVHSNPWERAYLLALACCLHHLEQYESAGRFYGLALLLDATDAHCAYRIGECLSALEHPAEAREAYESAVKLSWLDPVYAEVRGEAELRLGEMSASGA